MKNKIIAVILVIITLVNLTTVTHAVSAVNYFYTDYELTGDPATDMVKVAEAQLGRNMYSHYGCAWCAAFISDLAKIIGEEAAIPGDTYVEYLYYNVLNAGGTIVETPQAGDLCFYYCNTCEDWDGKPWVHVGLCIDNCNSIDGNYNSAVTKNSRLYTHRNHKAENIDKVYVRPNYSKKSSSVEWTPYLNFLPFDAYLRVEEKHPCYNDRACTSYAGRIYVEDRCKIREVYTMNGEYYCRLECPWDSGGTKTVYTTLSAFIDTSFNPYAVISTSNSTTYIRSNVKSTEFGYTGLDPVLVVGEVNGMQHVVYPLAENKGHKAGWVTALSFTRPSVKITKTYANAVDLEFYYPYLDSASEFTLHGFFNRTNAFNAPFDARESMKLEVSEAGEYGLAVSAIYRGIQITSPVVTFHKNS